MKPTDWINRTLRISRCWMAGALCCLPLMASPEQERADEFAAKQYAESIKRGKEATKATIEKLQATIIPHVSFKEASIDEVAASLSKTLEGVLPALKSGTTGEAVPSIRVMKSYGYKPTPVTVDMKNESAANVLKEVAKQAGMEPRVTLTGVMIWPTKEKLEKAKAAADKAAAEKAEAEKAEAEKAEAEKAEADKVAAPGGGGDSGASGGADGGASNASSTGQDASGSFLMAMKGVLDPFFTWICAATLRASVIGGVIVGLQLLLGRMIPARWRYALWAPMVLVLVLPVLPEVPFGLFPAKEAVIAPQVVEVPAVDVPASTAVVAAVTTGQGSKAVSVNPYALIWLGGVLGVLAFGISGYRGNLRRIIGKQVAVDGELMSSIQQAANEVKLRKLPRVIVSTAVETPAVAGLMRPSLLLPVDFKTAFTAEEARLVLIHELTHLKRHDLLVNWLCCALQALHWFNPVLWFAFARMRDDRESACDDQVLSLDGGDHRSAYGHALLKLQASPVSPALHLGFVGIFERNAGLKSRIREIGRHRKVHPACHAVGVSLLAALLVFGTTKAQEVKPKLKPRPTEVAKAKVISPATAAIEKKLDAIVLPVVRMKDETVEVAIDFLRIRAVELDTEPDRAKKGVNFVIRKPRTGETKAVDPGKLRVTLDLKNVSMRKVFEDICVQTGLQYKVDEFAVTFVPASEAPAPTDPGAPARVKPSGKAMDAAGKIIIPVVDFENTSLEEAVDFLRLRAAELSLDKKGVAIEFKAGAKKDAVIPMLQLRNVPLSQTLGFIAETTKQPWGANDEGLWIGAD